MERAGILVLLDHVVEGEGGDCRIWHLVLVGQVGYQHGRVLLKLGQVESHILLVELSVIVVLHVFGDHEGEDGVGASELLDRALHVILDLDHVLLHDRNLRVLRLAARPRLLNLLRQTHAHLLLLLPAHHRQLLVLRDLTLNVAVLLSDGVDLRVQHIHVVVERIVLLLSLNKGGHDLLSR